MKIMPELSIANKNSISIPRPLCRLWVYITEENGKTTTHIWLVGVYQLYVCPCICDSIPVKLQRSL